MAFAPLILRGNQTIDATDVSDQVTSFKIMGTRDQIDIPATFGSKASYAAGNDTYEVEIEYLSDMDATAVTQLLWTELDDTDGTVVLTGTFEDGAVSAANPEFTMTAVVTGVGVGGEVNTVGLDSQTFPLTGRPTQATS